VRTSVRKGEPKLVQTIPKEPIFVSERVGEIKVVSRNTFIDKNFRKSERALESKELRPSINQSRANKTIYVNRQRANIIEKVIPKHIKVKVEKPVPQYREVEVPYDVIIEKPIERLIEKDVITEIVVKKQVDKVYKVPIEKIMEVPQYIDSEEPQVIDKIIEVPVDKIVEKKIEIPVENIIYDDNVIECNEQDIGRYQYDIILEPKVKKVQRSVGVRG